MVGIRLSHWAIQLFNYIKQKANKKQQKTKFKKQKASQQLVCFKPKNKNNLKFCHLNIERGLMTNKNEIEVFLEEIKPDFFAVTKHDLSKTAFDCVILENYEKLVNSAEII